MQIYTVIFSIVFVLFLHIINCQICTKRKAFTEQYTEYRNYTYLGKIINEFESSGWTYLKPGQYKRKVEVSRVPVVLTRKVVQNINVCCNGYVRVDSGDDDDRIDCQPLCVPNCIHGRCEIPGQCSCNEGYKKDLQRKCTPICFSGCKHGNCIEPNICGCNPGYQNYNGTCRPICTEQCHNGICAGPDICECLDGYRKSENNTCEPYCFSGCEYGTCVAPNTCSCDEGWQLGEEQKCIATCDPECMNGLCVAPNTCQCLPGYENYWHSDVICKPICKNCQGYCVAPYNCVCDPPFKAKNVTAYNKDCDCFHDCSDSDKECDSTICWDPTQIDILDDEATDATVDYSSTFNIYESTTEIEDILSTHSIIKNDKQGNDSGVKFPWTFIMLIGLLFLLILLLVVVIMKWKKILIYFKGMSYVVEDTGDETTSQYVNVPLSSVTSKSTTKH